MSDESLPLRKLVPSAEERVQSLLDAAEGTSAFDLDELCRAHQESAMRERWMVYGRPITRDQAMSLAVMLVESGTMLSAVSRIPGMPTLATFLKWRDAFPESFGEPLRLAEEAASYQLVEDSMEILDAATDKSAFKDLNRAKARQWLAAKFNKRFTEKIRTEDETPIQTMGDQELKEAFLMALKNDAPKLKELGVALNFDAIDVTPEQP